MFRRALLLWAMVGGCDDGPGGAALGPRSSFDEAQAAAARAACQFRAGTLPGLSLAHDTPLGPEIPIDTVVVVMMENRSFDHMLGNLAASGQPDAEVAPPDVANPDAQGHAVARFHQTALCFDDTSHSWRGAHTEWDGGKNDGFVLANEPDGRRAMGYYTQDDIPIFYWLANTFAIADHYHASLLGPTEPNRMYLYAATSFGRIDNNPFFDRRANVMELLEQGQVSWHVYSETIPGLGLFADSATRYFRTRFGDLDAFFANAKKGTLEHVVFVDPDLRNEYGGGDDLHPPGDVQKGDVFLGDIVESLMQSPQWPRTALFITFDEWGGLYDHVPPPAACPPDDLLPELAAGDPPGAFDRLGFRVPLIAVSPWVKPHSVSHHTYDHSSILRFIEARFVLPAMTARDANADPMLDLFDFSRAALASPPALPIPALDPQKLMDCADRFPNHSGG